MKNAMEIRKMLKTGIIGAGDVGANAAFFLAERNVGPVVVRDIQEGLATGKTLDIMEMAPLGRYRYPVGGTDSEQEVLESDVLLIAAGVTRTPGTSRDTLFGENRDLIVELAGKLNGYEGVVVVATEPVDAVVTLLVRESGIDPKRVLGLGGCLDAARLRYFIARDLGCFSEDVDTVVVGRHDRNMIVPTGYSRVAGIPVEHLLSEEKITSIIEELRGAGDSLLELSKRGSAFYTPAAVATDIIEAIVADTGRILSVSNVLDGQFDVQGAALSLPAMIGRSGIRRLILPKLSDTEHKAFTASGSEVAKLVG